MSKDLILESAAKTTQKLRVLVSNIGPYFNLKSSKVFYGPQITLMSKDLILESGAKTT